ncbi:MAG: carboxypeptidase-like regulatory domain-containing protein [Bacteroidota bacterium]
MKTIFLTHITFLLILLPGIGKSQLVTITGYVKHSIKDNALENVSIFESNSGIGTITNQNGFYKLVLKKGNSILSFTDDGFKEHIEQLELQSDTTLIIKLEPQKNGKDRPKKDVEIHAGAKTKKKPNRRSGYN